MFSDGVLLGVMVPGLQGPPLLATIVGKLLKGLDTLDTSLIEAQSEQCIVWTESIVRVSCVLILIVLSADYL